jgi:uncharacterized membrane protein YwzB
MEQGNNILDTIAFSTTPPSHVQLRDNSHRAKVAVILIAVVIGMLVISLVSDVLQYNLLNRALISGISQEEAETNDRRQLLIVIVYVIAYIVSAVYFIRWFRRAYYNLGLAGINKRFTDGWAAGAWFVPILNWFRPVRIMNEIWEKNSMLLERVSSDRLYELTGGKPLVALWWTAFILAELLARVEYFLTRGARSIEDFINLTGISIFSDCALIVTGLMMIAVLRKVASQEKEIYARQHLIPGQPVYA